MAAKQYFTEGSSDYLSPSMKQEQLSASFSHCPLEVLVMVKHQRTSVPVASYHAKSEGTPILCVDDPDHSYESEPVHMKLRAPDPARYRWNHKTDISDWHSNIQAHGYAVKLLVSRCNDLEPQCYSGALELSVLFCNEAQVQMLEHQLMTAECLGIMPPAKEHVHLVDIREEEGMPDLSGSTTIRDCGADHFDPCHPQYAGYPQTASGVSMPNGQYGYSTHIIPPP